MPWDYGHLDYLPGQPLGAPIPSPVVPPRAADPVPAGFVPWKPSWSAAIIASQFR